MFVVVTHEVSLHLDPGARIEIKELRVWQGEARAELEVIEAGRDETHSLNVTTSSPEHLRSLARAFNNLAYEFEERLVEARPAQQAQ